MKLKKNNSIDLETFKIFIIFIDKAGRYRGSTIGRKAGQYDHCNHSVQGRSSLFKVHLF